MGVGVVSVVSFCGRRYLDQGKEQLPFFYLKKYVFPFAYWRGSHTPCRDVPSHALSPTLCLQELYAARPLVWHAHHFRALLPRPRLRGCYKW